MAGFYGIEQREVIRVKVKKCDGYLQPEYKKFSLDPQITSYEMLQHILASAFCIKGDFTLSYRAKDDEGHEIYLSMLSDWDMDAAFQSASDPYLQLKVDLKPFEEGLDDWDIIAPVDVPQYKVSNLVERNSIFGALTGAVSNLGGRTVSHMQKVMGLKVEDETKYRPSKAPMTDLEFRNYLDSSGHMVKPEEFRISIYQGGVEPALRRVVWRHLLNIFPMGLSGKERFDYMKKKEQEYYTLRDQWRGRISGGSLTEETKYVTTMVKKDVLRTDRTHKFFSGADDSKNLLSLFNILVTYAITHPEVSYCQGMSDIASPLLVIQKDEAQAYLCLCAIMNRLRVNFMLNENVMNMKFKHLGDLLQLQDPILYTYLKDCHAHDLFFCYRWLLLELKREFPFDDALYMLEVMWSTLPPCPPEKELILTDSVFSPALLSTSPCSPSFSIKQTVYAKLLALRVNNASKVKDTPKGQSKKEKASEDEIRQNSPNNNSKLLSKNTPRSCDSPFDEDKPFVSDSQDFPSMKDSIMIDVQAKSESIDKSLTSTNRLNSLSAKDFNTSSILDGDTNGADTPILESDKSEAKCQGHVKNSNILGSDLSLNTSSSLSHSIHDEKPAGSFYNGSLSCETPDEYDNIKTEVDNSSLLGTLSLNGDEALEDCDEQVVRVDSSEDKLGDDECNEIHDDEDQDDSGQSQFYISIESNEESINITCNGNHNSKPAAAMKPEKQRKGFFSNMKDLISTPKKRPNHIKFHHPRSDEQKNGEMPIPGKASLVTENKTSGQTVKEIASAPSSSNNVLSPISQNSNKLLTDCRNGKVSESVHLEGNDSGMSLSDCAEVLGDSSLEIIKHNTATISLPSPDEFGGGNPFLMFLCVTLLVQQREIILRNRMEYDEIAMMFDKMVRKHSVHKVLHQARILYTDYLQTHKKLQEATTLEEDEVLNV